MTPSERTRQDGRTLRVVYGGGVLVGLLGLAVGAAVPGSEPISATLHTTVVAALAMEYGYLQPANRWHAGLAVAIPFLLVLGIHLGSGAA